MNIRNLKPARNLLGVAVASVLLAACASAPTQPTGAMAARTKLMQLQSDQDLATRAPLAIKDADAAVRIAEMPTKDADLAVHRVYIADRRIDIARAQAETRLAEDQRTALSEQRERARLDARTREADAAKSQAAQARGEADAARGEADAAADAAKVAAASAAEQAAELQRQIDALQARPTDRGLVLTLGDVLFSTGKADLKAGATSNLNRLVSFLGKYPTYTAMIEGHTDSVGSDEYNQSLSQRRADSVRTYLVGQGIAPERLTAVGKGEGSPVVGNDSAEGRQQNRRVEVIMNNPAVTGTPR